MQTNQTEAKTATNGGSVSTTANNQLNNIKRASDHLRMNLVDYGEFGIIERVAENGAMLSALTLAVRQALQTGNIEELAELNIDSFITTVCELPIFIESLTKVMGSVSYLTHTIEQNTAE